MCVDRILKQILQSMSLKLCIVVIRDHVGVTNNKGLRLNNNVEDFRAT